MEKSLYDIYLENMNNVEAISEEIDDRNIRSLTAE
jgi:diadenosine tetraphosphate (Ap4A) HIT family hydrolase